MDANGKASINGKTSRERENNRTSEIVILISDEEREVKSCPRSDASREEAEQTSNSPLVSQSNGASPNNNVTSTTTLEETIRTMPITPKTPLMASPGGIGGEDEDEEFYKRVSIRKKSMSFRVRMKVLIEWIAFISIMGCLVASLTVDKLQRSLIWGLEIWKWCVLVMATFNGMLVARWINHFVFLLIERKFILRSRVMYFVHGSKKSVQVFIWMILVLITWVLLFNTHIKVKKSAATSTRISKYITRTIVSLLIGTFLWLLKNLLLKILASSFYFNTTFDRIKESVFHQYILQTLSGPPLMESAKMVGRTNSTSQLSFQSTKMGKEGKETELIDINKLRKIKREKVSAWTMKKLVGLISNSGLSTSSSAHDEIAYDVEDIEQMEEEITSEAEAIYTAYHIFRNVAQPGCGYIDELDLRRFMIKQEVDVVLPMIDIGETGRINRKALRDWVVNAYRDRKALTFTINDTKTFVKNLNKFVAGVVIIVIIVVWLLLMGIATISFIFVLSSQLALAAFMFGNTCKTIFEGIIFVYVMHPFDVGDRCVIDGVQMIVEEMNIFSTVFLRYDNEKIYYPNSVLALKPISNFYRSPEMGDCLEFSINFTSPVGEKIKALKDRVKKYFEKNPQYWRANHSMVVKEIENVNKIKMALNFCHNMNFQDFEEKNRRRSELALEMNNIFEELNINYNLLPQEVRRTQSASATAGTTG